MSAPSIVLHGGTPLQRQQLAQRLLTHTLVRVRSSSRAAEAAKCLRDEAVIAVVLMAAPRDGAAVRALAESISPPPLVWDYVADDEAMFLTALVARIAERRDAPR